ncbi:MAG: Gfo/Idh/MocA family protein [Opitutaceae bacterium]
MKFSKKTIRWGILGCGNVTELKSGPAFSKVPHSRLVAVMRRNRAAAEDYAKRHAVPTYYDDADALINDPEVDAIYIATPPSSHAELAIKVAAAGKPCYVEKPMACSAKECDTMVDAFKEAQQPLSVAYYRRALPHFQRVKGMIDGEEFGELEALKYTFANSAQCDPEKVSGWRFKPEISGGGLFWDLGSHALDLFDYWCGPLEQPSGQVKNISGRGEVEEVVSMRANYGKGKQLSANWSFVSNEREDTVTLHFTKAIVRCSIFGKPELLIHESNGKEYREQFQQPENIQLPLITNVVASLRGEAVALSSGQIARRTNQIIDTVAQR